MTEERIPRSEVRESNRRGRKVVGTKLFSFTFISFDSRRTLERSEE